MRQPVPIDAGLRRETSRLGFGAMALNGVIDPDIFALPAVAAEAAGLFSPWLFLGCSGRGSSRTRGPTSSTAAHRCGW